MNLNDSSKATSLQDAAGFRLPEGFRAVVGDGRYQPGTQKIELTYQGPQSAGYAIKALFDAYSKDGAKMVGSMPGHANADYMVSFESCYSRG